MTQDDMDGQERLTPLAQTVADWVRAHTARPSGTVLLMLSGAQGIGKSSALAALADLDRLRIAQLSLDDFYHTAQARRALARAIHPLAETRGPPGTHDIALMREIIGYLRDGSGDGVVASPRFDKLADDRVARPEWQQLATRPDVILVEGWLMGVRDDATSLDDPPLNGVEAEDSQCDWRRWQEETLRAEYEPLWMMADGFLHLRAPSFETVLDWRIEQEETLRGIARGTLPADQRAWVARFIQHYERLTRRMLNGHHWPGLVALIDRDRQPIKASSGY